MTVGVEDLTYMMPDGAYPRIALEAIGYLAKAAAVDEELQLTLDALRVIHQGTEDSEGMHTNATHLHVYTEARVGAWEERNGERAVSYVRVKHPKGGEIYVAVQDSAGRIVKAAGPMYSRQMLSPEVAIGNNPNAESDGAWLERELSAS